MYSSFVKCFTVKGSLAGLPDCVEKSGNSHMKNYFKWIMDLQNFVKEWQTKILEDDCTQQEILIYAAQQIPIENMSKHIQMESLQLTPEAVAAKKTQMVNCKEASKEMLISAYRDGRKYAV